MKKSNAFQDFIKPIVVLLAICLVVAVLLGLVNGVTEPIIAENARIKAEQTRAAVLEGAQSFAEIDCDTAALGIDSAYKEESGLGFVLTASNKGYGGLVTVTVGLDNEGKVVGISADVSTETSGVGSKAGLPSYTDKYLGATGNVDAIDTITSATYSSSAVKNSVNAILAAFPAISSAEVKTEGTETAEDAATEETVEAEEETTVAEATTAAEETVAEETTAEEAAETENGGEK